MEFGLPDAFDHASWRVAMGTAISYVAILLAMFFLLFVVPFLVFWMSGSPG
jgi:hypothetical protein